MDFSAIRTKMQSVCRGQTLQGQDAAAVLEVAEICVHTCLCIGTYISILMTLLLLRGRLLRKAGPGAFHMGLMFLRNIVTVSFKCQCDCDVCFWIPTCHSWESREWWMSQKAWFFHGFCLQGPALISCPDFFFSDEFWTWTSKPNKPFSLSPSYYWSECLPQQQIWRQNTHVVADSRISLFNIIIYGISIWTVYSSVDSHSLPSLRS